MLISKSLLDDFSTQLNQKGSTCITEPSIIPIQFADSYKHSKYTVFCTTALLFASIREMDVIMKATGPCGAPAVYIKDPRHHTHVSQGLPVHTIPL